MTSLLYFCSQLYAQMVCPMMLLSLNVQCKCIQTIKLQMSLQISFCRPFKFSALRVELTVVECKPYNDKLMLTLKMRSYYIVPGGEFFFLGCLNNKIPTLSILFQLSLVFKYFFNLNIHRLCVWWCGECEYRRIKMKVRLKRQVSIENIFFRNES